MPKDEVFPLTGELRDWRLDTRFGGIIWGRVFGDTKGRFYDGDRIHTSTILVPEDQQADLKEGDVVETLNSRYLLGNKREEE